VDKNSGIGSAESEDEHPGHLIVSGDIFMTDNGVNVTRDIRLSNNNSGLRFTATNGMLTSSPNGRRSSSGEQFGLAGAVVSGFGSARQRGADLPHGADWWNDCRTDAGYGGCNVGIARPCLGPAWRLCGQ